ncbi:hypothetical protein PFISCL1PPCAC_13143, partial [Pristionchus fissidentatus]
VSSALSAVLLVSLAGLSAAQCGKSDHPSCADWDRNVQFCTSSARTLEMRQAYCPKFCANLGCATTTTTTTTKGPIAPGADANLNCVKWSEKTDASSFCVNPATSATVKTQICAKTCAFEIKPNAECALYTVKDNKLKRGSSINRTTASDPAVASGVAAGTTLSRVFASPGCTLRLFAAAPAATPPEPTAALEPPFEGSATEQFFTVQTINNGALSYTCSCS